MDESFMRQALEEAKKGVGFTYPNPSVGAVIVRKNRVIARGWHRKAGGPHAEIEAISKTTRTAGATIYVTLEPCSTHGRTPPCTEAILKAGFSRVVYGATDPNPRHVGQGRKILEAGGISVTEGVLAAECSALNAGWNKWISTGKPYVIAKAGMSLDGRINSPPEQRWLTGPASRRDAMKLRARVQAILVGGETVRADDPQLTIRGVPHREQPLRVVWTKSGNLPGKAKLFTDEFKDRTLVYQNRSLRSVLADLGRRGVASVLIEGGARVLGEAFDRELVDEVCFYLAPMLIGGPVPVVGGRGAGSNAEAIRLANPVYSRIGQDVKLAAQIAPR
jgi:diaminohydroxyphosphoribosylaminopyrimidine deaminase/5-amino-6-(5-phosphoribosylamino)uracil reductase